MLPIFPFREPFSIFDDQLSITPLKSLDDRSNMNPWEERADPEYSMGIDPYLLDERIMSKVKTKDLLLEAGKKSFLEKGYNNSGIESILQEAGVPKGSFYHYFENKEDFGLQVLDRFAECIGERQIRILSDDSVPPLDRLRNYFESVSELLRSDQCRKGCLVGNLSQEMADQSEVFRARLEEIFESWVDRYAECLKEAQDAGEVSPDLDVRELAEFWLNSWQGAILRAKTMRSVEPLRTFLTVMFGTILQAQR
jgi:TetR/AcrR family transcriptional regulator, transcriptional repressor for nem operon